MFFVSIKQKKKQMKEENKAKKVKVSFPSFKLLFHHPLQKQPRLILTPKKQEKRDNPPKFVCVPIFSNLSRGGQKRQNVQKTIVVH